MKAPQVYFQKEEEMADKKKKTDYCIHSLICKREEDCYNGEGCPFFQTKYVNDPEPEFNPQEEYEKEMKRIWNGEIESD